MTDEIKKGDYVKLKVGKEKLRGYVVEVFPDLGLLLIVGFFIGSFPNMQRISECVRADPPKLSDLDL